MTKNVKELLIYSVDLIRFGSYQSYDKFLTFQFKNNEKPYSIPSNLNFKFKIKHSYVKAPLSCPQSDFKAAKQLQMVTNTKAMYTP